MLARIVKSVLKRKILLVLGPTIENNSKKLQRAGEQTILYGYGPVWNLIKRKRLTNIHDCHI